MIITHVQWWCQNMDGCVSLICLNCDLLMAILCNYASLLLCTPWPGCKSSVQQACRPAGVQVQPDSQSKPRQAPAAGALCHSGSKLTLAEKENYHMLLCPPLTGGFHSLCQGSWTASVLPDTWGEGGSWQTFGGCPTGSATGSTALWNKALRTIAPQATTSDFCF